MEYYINKPVCQETNKKLRALTYAFYTIPSNGEAMAIMRLRPVLKRISAFTMTNDKTKQL